jgi:MFS family permease
MIMNEKVKGLQSLVRALKYRNFRLFFMGQAISLIGTWMQSIATGWLAYKLTGSEVVLGFVGFAGQIPAFFGAPLGGVLADRWNRHRLLVITQILSMVQALTLAVLATTGLLNVYWIVGLAAFLGLINGFDIPIRHSFVTEMVEDREDLGNAIALNSSVFNGARLIGPTVAGILIARYGEAMCFWLNGVSYIAVLAALFSMKLYRKENLAPVHHQHPFEGFKEGLKYAAGHAPIRSVLLLICLFSFVPFTVLLPVFAKVYLQGDSHTYGFLVGASGFGAFIGAVFLASRRNANGFGKVIAISCAIFGAGIMVFAFSTILWVSLALMVLVGFGMMVTSSASNTVLQMIADDDKRGRVMSFYTMAFMGTAPLGSLLGGVLANRFGAPDTFLFSGLCCIAGALIFAMKVPALTRIAHETRQARKEEYETILPATEPQTEMATTSEK